MFRQKKKKFWSGGPNPRGDPIRCDTGGGRSLLHLGNRLKYDLSDSEDILLKTRYLIGAANNLFTTLGYVQWSFSRIILISISLPCFVWLRAVETLI